MRASYLKNLNKLEDSILYYFSNKDLFLEALTHSSYSNENLEEAPTYNERLEFLGDAVLGLAVVEKLFSSKGRLSESKMAKLKSFLVSKTVLSNVARKLNLGKTIRLGKGEISSGGRDKDNILADALEAVIGAVFIDSGYENAKGVILNILKEEIKNILQTEESNDYKTELQEITQNLYATLPEYRVILEEGEEHNKTFTVEVIINNQSMGSGKGRSKKDAQMMAAKEALNTVMISSRLKN